MEINLAESDDSLKKKVLPIVPETIYGRLLYAYCMIAAPLFAFIFSYDSTIGPEWQNGKFQAYPEILLSGEVNFYFYPFVLFSVICLILLLLVPERFAFKSIVRFGIYSGAILVGHYIFLLIISGYIFIVLISGIPAIIVGYALVKWAEHLIYEWGSMRFWLRLGGLLGTSVLILGSLSFFFNLGFVYSKMASVLFGLWMIGLVLIVPLTGRLCYRLWKQHEAPELWTAYSKLGLGIWLTAYFVQWSSAFFRAGQIYNNLPTEQPDCYIATAAAKGHPRLVGSTQVGPIRLNRQLQTLKAAEILLVATHPNFHLWLRRWYDIYGRYLATKITHPLLADFAYLTLKPFEWMGCLALFLLIPDAGQHINSFYTDKSNQTYIEFDFD